LNPTDDEPDLGTVNDRPPTDGSSPPLSRRTSSLVVSTGVLLAVVLAVLPLADETGRAHVDETSRRALVGHAGLDDEGELLGDELRIGRGGRPAPKRRYARR